MTALATVADLAGRLGVTTPPDPSPQRTQWEALLDDASAAVRDAIGCDPTRATSTVRLPTGRYPTTGTRDGWQAITLPAVPAVSIESVTAAGRPVPFELVDAHTLRVQAADTILTVAYTHGWDPIPDELRRWTLVLAASMLQAVGTGNLGMAGGISSIRVDDGQVSYAASAPAAAVDLPDRIAARLRATYGPSTLEVRG